MIHYEYDEEKKIFSSDPLHDWASHDGDGFSYGCLIAQLAAPPPPPPAKPKGIIVGANEVSLNELYASQPRPSERI